MCPQIIRRALLLTTLLAILLSTGATARKPTVVELYQSPWSFPGSTPQSSLTAASPQAEFEVKNDSCFTLRFRIDLHTTDRDNTVLEIPDVLRVLFRNQTLSAREAQNYYPFKMADGSVPVLEARLRLQLPDATHTIAEMTVGFPLATVKQPWGRHDVVVQFSGARLTLYFDGELMDNDFPLGYPLWNDHSRWTIDPRYVSQAELYVPCLTPTKTTLDKPRIAHEIQYWTPQWADSWVGDVVTLFANGRYHVFYLFDRRGAGSKFGRGGHYFEHLSTADFKTWTEHEAAVPIERQWETFGTGTPFVHDGKLCISYGMHTTRIYPRERTALPLQWDALERTGHTSAVAFDTLTVFPAGSSYAVSDDGVHFRKSGLLIHPCENPSIYTDPDGHLRMMANYGCSGTWASDSLNGGWHPLDRTFPPGGDCTFYFRWGNFDYIIGGFTGLWMKPKDAPQTAYRDMVAEGIDCYDGLCVPSISAIGGNRYLMAGWMLIASWGGTLNIHELIQMPDGRLGSKWMDEITPETVRPETLSRTLDATATYPVTTDSYLLTFDVIPHGQDSRVGVSFMSIGDTTGCEWQLSTADRTAQYAPARAEGYAAPERSLRQKGSPHFEHHFAIENMTDVDRPYKVRMIVKAPPKFRGSLIDTEIAGKRTMITFQHDLSIRSIRVHPSQATVRNLRIAPLKYQ